MCAQKENDAWNIFLGKHENLGSVSSGVHFTDKYNMHIYRSSSYQMPGQVINFIAACETFP